MKMLQGQLKETLFEWPDGKSQGDMVQKSQRILQENEVAYINGKKTWFVYPSSILIPLLLILLYLCARAMNMVIHEHCCVNVANLSMLCTVQQNKHLSHVQSNKRYAQEIYRISETQT